MNIVDWFVATLRQYPEIALLFSIGIGYWVGQKSFKGFSLGAVTSTLLAAILIGQFGIKISGDVKSVFFLLFLFAIGYGVGPQFVRGITKDGIPQAIFGAIVCGLCLAAHRGREIGGLRCRRGRGTLCRIANDLGLDGARDRCNRSPRAPPGSSQVAARYHAHRLCGDVHLRHGRLSDSARAIRAAAVANRSEKGL